MLHPYNMANLCKEPVSVIVVMEGELMFLFSLRWFMCVFRRRCYMNIWNPRKFKNFVLYKFSHIITCSLGNYHFIMLWSEIFERVVFSDLIIPFFIWMSLQIHFPFIVKNYQLRNEFYDGEPILERFHQSKLWGIHYTKIWGIDYKENFIWNKSLSWKPFTVK